MLHRWTNGHDHMPWNINFNLAICHLPNAIPDSASYYNYYNNNLHACFCWLTGRQLNDSALDIENWGIWIRLLMHQYAYIHIPIYKRNMQIYIWGWNNWNFLFSCNLKISGLWFKLCIICNWTLPHLLIFRSSTLLTIGTGWNACPYGFPWSVKWYLVHVPIFHRWWERIF